jgi:hypothetical protein
MYQSEIPKSNSVQNSASVSSPASLPAKENQPALIPSESVQPSFNMVAARFIDKADSTAILLIVVFSGTALLFYVVSSFVLRLVSDRK